MVILLKILIFLAALLLILTVLIQNPKGGGLASEFSSANQIGGVQETADFLEKATWTLAVGIMVLTLFRAGLASREVTEEEKQGNQLEKVMDNQMSRQNPMTPTPRAGKGKRKGTPRGQGQGSGQGGQGSKSVKEALKKKKKKKGSDQKSQ